MSGADRGGRACLICGQRRGGCVASTLALRALGLEAPAPSYAHPECLRRARRRAEGPAGPTGTETGRKGEAAGPAANNPATSRSKAARGAALARWGRVSAADRAEVGRSLSLARWGRLRP